jgi:phenylalanyl-tRNA synthetase beta chain
MLLRGIEFGVEDKGDLEVTVPTFTGDITREEDLIEEIIRLEGYEAIPGIDVNKGPLIAGVPEEDIFKEEIRRICTSQGFDEIYSGGMADQKLLAEVSAIGNPVRVINPIAKDLTVMEDTALYTLIKSASHNISHRNIDLRLFVIARIYIPGKPPEEKYQVGLLVTGRSADEWFGKGRELGFHDLKGAIEMITGSPSNPDIIYEEKPFKAISSAISYDISCSDNDLGLIGKVDEKAARAFDIKQDLYVALLDFDTLFNLRKSEINVETLPKFPAAPRDLAIIVEDSAKVGEILTLIRKIGGEILEKVELFDLFRGKQIGEGKKSLAFAMTYRSRERSLENEEIQAVHNKIAETIKKQFKAEIREG